jgi:hypothetical protein
MSETESLDELFCLISPDLGNQVEHEAVSAEGGCDSVIDQHLMIQINEGAHRDVLLNSIKRRRRPRLLAADKAELLLPELVAERPGILSGYRVHFTPFQCLERSAFLLDHPSFLALSAIPRVS